MENNEYRFYRQDDNGYPNGYGGYSQSDFHNPMEDRPRKKKKRGPGKAIALILACAIAGGGAGIGGSAFYNEYLARKNQNTTVVHEMERPQVETVVNVNPNQPMTPHQLYAANLPSCVGITVSTTTVNFFGQTSTSAASGSGFVLTTDGYIVTNYHVANEMCTSITVILYDGSRYEAQYIYGDELSDLAVIKIEKTDCDYAVFGDSDHMTYGDLVLAIGNPKGLGLSVTDGIISRPGESVTFDDATMTLLRTSAAINNGNSGGGLFNLKGELIGIVNAKLASSSIDNIGYAIPSITVVKCINDLKEHGYITGRARLGVTVNTKTYQVSWIETRTIIQVADISPNGSAANSGLQVGDILYRYEGVDITSFEILSQQLTKYSVGDTIKLTVLRPTIELTSNNLQQYINTAKEVEITITFTEFNPNA
jgi:serine protease Do